MMTPMKKMQGVFKEFNTLAGKVSTMVELQGQDSKYNSYNGNETKGVDSDFIRIYKAHPSKGDSFAFAFNHYKEDLEKTQVVISMITKEVHSSTHMPLVKFNEKFKEFLKLVKILAASDVLSFTAMMNTSRSVFGIEKGEEVDYKAISQKMIELVEPEFSKYEKALNAYNTVQAERKVLEKEINAKVRVFEQALQKELKYPELVKKEYKAKEKIEEIKEKAVVSLNERVTKVKDLYRFLTYRALKNSIQKSIDPLLKEKTHSNFTFWKVVFEKVLINHQGHRD